MTRAQPARRARRADRRARAHLERRAPARLQAVARRRACDGRAPLSRHRDPVRVRLLRPAHALPPREDDRDRRPRRVRRRHRPDLRRRRPVRQPGALRPWRRRLARRRGSPRGTRASPTSPSTSGCAGTAPRTRSCRRPPSPTRRATSTRRSCARSPRTSTSSSLPRGDFSVLESYVGAIRSAERFIYIENQFLWSPEIVELLAEKLRNPPRDDFRIVVLLPVQRERRSGRLPRAGRRAHPRRRRQRTLPRLLDLRAHAASSATRSTSTPRSRSSTTAG